MRLRVEEAVFAGTPVQIVEALRLRDESAPRTVDEYMMRFLERAATYRRFAITGTGVEDRCARFLTGLIRNLDAEIA